VTSTEPPAGAGIDRAPRLEPDGVAPEAFGSRDGGEYAIGPRQKAEAAGIKIVRVMVVRQQHDVDRFELVSSERGPDGLDEPAVLPRR
jgi:hypothetical protein